MYILQTFFTLFIVQNKKCLFVMMKVKMAFLSPLSSPSLHLFDQKIQ